MTPTRHRTRRGPHALALAAAVALTACAPSPQQADPLPTATEPGAPARETTTIATGLEAPWSLVFHGDAPLVSERDSGRILEVADDGTTREVAVIDDVSPRGEGGLLGIAVHDGGLYVFFTAADENRIERFPLRGEPGALALGEGETILTGIPAGTNHNGGRIAFGPDGMLYATTGDAGDTGTTQDLDSLAGKILRIAPDGSVPDDNPFPGSLVYSYGHRNPQGIGWRSDGTLYASEFGQNTWDELNVIEPGGNYGWPEVEGIAGAEGYIDPVQQWPPAVASPSGIAVTGESIVIANLRGARLREVPFSDLSTSTERHIDEFGRLRDAVTAPDGSVWLLTNNTDGRGSPQQGDDRILRLAD